MSDEQESTSAGYDDNVMELVERRASVALDPAHAPSVQIRSSPEHFGDVTVFFTTDVDSKSLTALTSNLSASPEFSFAKRSGRKLTLRLSDPQIAELGR
jgi:hypothetical protein